MNSRIVTSPKDLIRCTRCVMPETQEAIIFDAEGVCSTCRQFEIKHAIDWEKRKEMFREIVGRYKGKGEYDCIVPVSGGKDSTFTAYSLVKDFGLKPLLVRFHHQLLRPAVLRDTDRTVKRLGVDLLEIRANWQLIKKMIRIGLERKGDILWYQHAGIFSFPMHVAIKFNIPLIIWGEPSAEYTSYYGYDEIEEMDERQFNTYVNIGITAEDMQGFIGDPSVTMRDLWPYKFPELKDLQAIGYKSIFLGSFVPWDVQAQTKIIQDELGWEGDIVEGVPPEYNYEKIEDMMQGVQDYLKFMKRGYGRMSQLATLDIRNGRMTREKAMELLEKWEGKRPCSLDVLLRWLKMTEEEFNNIVKPLAIDPWRFDPARTPRGLELPDQQYWIPD